MHDRIEAARIAAAASSYKADKEHQSARIAAAASSYKADKEHQSARIAAAASSYKADKEHMSTKVTVDAMKYAADATRYTSNVYSAVAMFAVLIVSASAIAIGYKMAGYIDPVAAAFQDAKASLSSFWPFFLHTLAPAVFLGHAALATVPLRYRRPLLAAMSATRLSVAWLRGPQRTPAQGAMEPNRRHMVPAGSRGGGPEVQVGPRRRRFGIF